MSKQKQDWNRLTKNWHQKQSQPRKSCTKLVDQRYWWVPGRHVRAEEYDNRTFKRPKWNQSSNPDRFQSVGIGKSRLKKRNIHSKRLWGEVNNDEENIGKLQEVTGELLGMLKTVTTSMEKIKVKFNSL